MAKYYYDRYTVNSSTYYTQGPFNFVRNDSFTGVSGSGGCTSYGFNSSTGIYTANNPGSYYFDQYSTLYMVAGGSSSGTYVDKYVRTTVKISDGNNSTPDVWNCAIYRSDRQQQTSYSRGSYIDTVVAENGTYPDNGISGGYWYVKVTPAPIGYQMIV